ncbi:MAG: hypothetical protein ACUVR1_03405 [Fimbriimonadales bacterium]
MRVLAVVIGVLLRAVGAGALFWGAFPLWLSLFWGVQGYPPTQGDLGRWYAIGAFNAAPIVATVLTTPAILLLMRLVRGRARHFGVSRLGMPLLGACLYALFVPPIAYALLLMYAAMWRYRAWDAMLPTLVRAYGLVGGAAFVVGWLLGWSVRSSGRDIPAGAVARRN